MTDKHIVVVGAGSVGVRHLRNFVSLGCRVSAVDPRSDRLGEAAEAVPLVNRWTELPAALASDPSLSGVAICSPTGFHVDQAIAALAAGLPVYLEKPVSTDAASAARLLAAVKTARSPLLLGYTYRWWPPIRKVKELLDRGTVGKVLHVHCMMSAHLADWHPWERYQDFFMSRRDLGGGALLDESHFLDLMLWFFGMPATVSGTVDHVSSLEIETDDNVDACLGYPNGMRMVMHLDLYGRPHERSITIRGEQGTLEWSYEHNRVRVGSSAQREWQESSFECERNDMFVDAAREFLHVVESGARPTCTIEDGYAVMRVIDALRRSSESASVIRIADAMERC